jgi:hypothetical protein
MKIRTKLKKFFTWKNLKNTLLRWLRFLKHLILNPKFLLCFGIAWIITNGWCYILFGLGMLFDISWMTTVAGAYMAFLWLPFTPEKIITFAIALALRKLFFPKDKKTEEQLNAMKRGKQEEQQQEDDKKAAS